MGDDTPVVTSLVLPILIRPILSQVGEVGIFIIRSGMRGWRAARRQLPEEKVVTPASLTRVLGDFLGHLLIKWWMGQSRKGNRKLDFLVMAFMSTGCDRCLCTVGE